MIKHIFFPILGSSSVESGASTAFQVTRRSGGHVEAICCRRNWTSDMVVGDDETNFNYFAERTKQFVREEKRRVSLARKAFDAARERYGVEYEQDPTNGKSITASWEIVTGNPADEVTARAGASDLVVVGRTDASVGTLTQGLVATALFGAGASVLVAPQTILDSIASNILIAWNRSASAARAVRCALPLLREANRVEILMVATGAKKGPGPRAYPRSSSYMVCKLR